MTEIKLLVDRARQIAEAPLPELHELEERTTELVDFNHQFLTAHELTVTFIESCTGMYANALLVMHDHVSKLMSYGQFTYSFAAKTKHLNIDEDEMKRVGEYSSPGAKLMAIRQRTAAQADIAVSITGVAGTKSDPANLHPMGVVWIGIATREHSYAEENDISERGYGRPDNIKAFSYLAHRQLLRYLLTLDASQCDAH